MRSVVDNERTQLKIKIRFTISATILSLARFFDKRAHLKSGKDKFGKH